MAGTATRRIKSRPETVVAVGVVGNGFHILEALLTVSEKGKDTAGAVR
jgi:hypothetical protein